MRIEFGHWNISSGEPQAFQSHSGPLRALLSTPATISEQQRRMSGLGGLEQFKGNVSVRASDLTITHRIADSSDERDLINAAKAAVELDFISAIPAPQRNRGILRRAADLQSIVRSVRFSEANVFIGLKKKVEESVADGQLKLSAESEARLGADYYWDRT